MELDFDLLKKEIFGLLGDKKIMVLATGSDNRITARSMSCLIMNGKIYFQTGNTSLKYGQMFKNPNAALCADNIQIEGVAAIKKHPFAEENSEFAQVYKEKYAGSYAHYSHLEDEVVVEIEPTLITAWKYGEKQPFRDFLDLRRNKAHREVLNI